MSFAGAAVLMLLHSTPSPGQAPNQSNEVLWKTIDEHSVIRAGKRLIIPVNYRTMRLNQAALTELLGRAPMEFTREAKENPAIISLPMPDGTLARFRFEVSPVIEPGLAAKYPELKTYRGQGLDDPAATSRFDWLPTGFHAIILGSLGTVLIDPYAHGNTADYITYWKRDAANTAGEFRCDFVAPPLSMLPAASIPVPAITSGTQLRTYRLALACTHEYAVAAGNDAIAETLAAEVLIMNRVNGVYERDVAIHMNIIAINDLITYAGDNLGCGPQRTEACTSENDFYHNDDGATMLNENQSNIDAVITSANYDIGHVFSTGGGGVAIPEVPCGSTKAKGVTGLPNPLGDAFAIDYVAHEMGHQWGAHHTFNTTVGFCGAPGQWTASAAYEPGSGVTIMAYSGDARLCGNQTLAAQSVDTFHVKSLEQIVAYSQSGNGNSCASPTPTGNRPPTVTAPGPFKVPKRTPFSLTASATDVDGDSITYDWQEYDLGAATEAVPNTDADGEPRPIFRPFSPTVGGTRIFPSLQYILNNANVPPPTTGAFLTGELLPAISRTMAFQVVARDNRGGINTAISIVTVVGTAGPFTVMAPNTPVTVTGGSQLTVTWNVANTAAPPVSAANVRISLSFDGGQTFPVILVDSTANDGSEAVSIPNVSVNNARIKVEAVGNIFFDISDQNFATAASGGPHYVAINLGTLGGSDSEGSDVNNSGQVTGASYLSGNSAYHAFVYSGDTMHDLGELDGGLYSEGSCINNSGEVTGSVRVNNFQAVHAFVYSGGSMQDLGALGGSSNHSYGLSINDLGHATGWSGNYAFVYSDGSMHALGTLGGSGSFGSDINNSGQVTGLSSLPGDSADRAFLYSGGSMRDLGTLGGYHSYGTGINNSGQVTGVSYLSGDSVVHAFVYSEGTMHDLGTLGGSYSEGSDINNSGQVIGLSTISGDSGEHTFVYSSGSMHDLGTLVTGNSAVAGIGRRFGINDSGQIAGSVYLPGDSQQRALLVTPFYRQVDPPPDVASTFGNGNDQTRNAGCALCSAANMCRSVIGLKSKATRIPIMTPKLLDSLLISANGYSPTNKMDFGSLPVAIAQLANVSLTTQAVTISNLDASLVDRIYDRRERAILEFRHTTHDQSTGDENTGAHFVWVIEKEGGDWKIADPGWNNVAPGTSPSVLESLQAHLNGFETRSGTTGHIISHQFVPKSLRSFRNLDFPGGPNLKDRSGRGVVALQTTSVAALTIDATGPVDLLLTDPQGRRLGHDQQSGNDYFEIPDGSYFHDEPIMFPDGDGFAGGDPNGSKNIFVPLPIAGPYTLQVTGTAVGTSTVSLRLMGPGGAARTTTNVIQTVPGVTSSQKFNCPEVTAADLTLALSASANSVDIGDTVTYSSVVTNGGPTAATGVSFTDILPDNADFVSAQSSAGTCVRSDNVVYCPLGDLSEGATATITIVTLMRMPGPNTNTAAVVAFENDPNGADNISSVEVNVAAPTPTATPTATPTGTATPTPINISGTLSYCSKPAPGPVPNVSLNVTGTMGGSTLSDGSGNYTFSSLLSGGNYIVTPTKATRVPGSTGITGVDAVATQRHFLNLGTPLSGCRLTAADVTGTNGVDGVDAVAIQRFFLGFTNGIANVGKYQFTPVSRSYLNLTGNQTAQNYDTLVFGDVAPDFVERLNGGPEQDAAGEVAPTVAAVALPDIEVDQSKDSFVAAVKTTAINAKSDLVGFQGDFTFDERVVSFESEPVRKAGLTGSDWNVAGNVLDGPGPIRTLRISAYSNDLTPLSGEGTLFELRMTRVTGAVQGTQLIWAVPPGGFIFIDANLNTQKPAYAASGRVTSRPSQR